MIFSLLFCYIFVVFIVYYKIHNFTRLTDFEVVLVSSRYKEDISWMRQALQTYPKLTICIYNCSNGTPIPIDIINHRRVHIYEKNNLRTLFYYFMKYIVDHYEQLPEYILFNHSHDTDWHQKINMNDNLFMLSEIRPFDYVNISDCVYDDWISENGDMLTRVRKGIDKHPTLLELFPELRNINTNKFKLVEINAGQGCVHRNNIRKIPLETYVKLKHMMTDYEHHNDYEWEGLFHVFMGEPVQRPFIKQHLDILRKSSDKSSDTKNNMNELQLRYFSK